MTIGWFVSFFLPFVQENVANHARDLVMHVSKMSSLLKDKRSHYEIVALDLALVWTSLSLSLYEKNFARNEFSSLIRK
jgi:hypothetical protein